jgi:GNAT superfamily N-acetyltransferase
VTIREATAQDVPDLVQLGLRFRASTSYADLLAENADQMRQTAERLITQDDGVVFVSEDAGGDVTGMIGCLVFVHHLSGAVTCGEVFLYVIPEARGHGARLIKQAEQWARNHDATTIQMIAPVSTEVGVLYTRLGYRAIEVAWQKPLTVGEAAA